MVIYLIQIQWIIGININQLPSEIDCSQYVNDDQIIKSFPFIVHVNPAIENFETTLAKMDKNENVVSMKIVNQEFIPSIIYCLKYLSKLQIINTSFCDSKHRLPAQIEYFASSLTDLHIADTTITHLPKQIGRLKHLQTLTLSNTGLMSLPDAIGDLLSLNFLILSNNNLTSLPMTITNLRSLQQLTLTNNPYLHSVEPLNGHSSLRILDTKHCPIEFLPHNLPQLTTLYMNNNNLTTLNDIQTLGYGTNSKKSFFFDKNLITSVSPQIQHVRNLYRLNLNNNKLYTLPTNIFEVTTLIYLNIQHNHFPPGDLKAIISKFHDKNPNLILSYN